MKRLTARALFTLGCFLSGAAAAQPVTYNFSTGPNLFGSLPSLIGSSVVGSFMYDASTPLTFTTTAPSNPVNASIYGGFLGSDGLPHSSYTNITATVLGGTLGATSFTFSDPRGQTTVSNEGLVSPPGSPPQDLLSVDIEPFGAAGIHNLVSPFSVDGFRLWNMRIFWSESITGGEIVGSQSLPSSLPTGSARLSLDFLPVNVAAGTPTTFVFYDNVQVTAVSPIPEPETYAMMVVGLALLGFQARRKRIAPLAA